MLQEFNSGDRKQIALSSYMVRLLTKSWVTSSHTMRPFALPINLAARLITSPTIAYSDRIFPPIRPHKAYIGQTREGREHRTERAGQYCTKRVTSTDSRTEHRSGFSIGSESNELRGELLTFGVKFYVRYTVGSRL